MNYNNFLLSFVLKRSFILFCWVVLFFSCSKEKTSLETIHVDFGKSLDKAYLSDFIDPDFQLIALETTPKSLIGRISKVVTTEDYIFVLDSYSTNSLFVFDKTGKFLWKIGKEGDGPGEYHKLLDFIIADDKVEILDNGYFIKTYKFDGEFVNNKKLPEFSAIKMAKNKKGGFVFISGKRLDNLLLTNKNLKIENSYFPFVNPYLDKMIINPFIQTGNGSILYRRFLNDTLYQILEDRIIPVKHIDYANKAFHIDIEKAKNLGEKIKTEFYDYCTTRFYYENKTHEYLVFLYKGEPWIHLSSKQRNASKLYKYSNRINDVFFDNTAYVVGTEDDQFIYLLQPSSFKESLDTTKDSDSPYFDKMTAFAKKLDNTDNPVLMFVKFDLTQ